MPNVMNTISLSKSIRSRYCDQDLYNQLMNEFNDTGDRPKKMVQIVKNLESEADSYELNEYELSLLTGVSVGALRNNRRPGRSHRWKFRKENTDKRHSRSKVSYPLKWIRDQLNSNS